MSAPKPLPAPRQARRVNVVAPMTRVVEEVVVPRRRRRRARRRGNLSTRMGGLVVSEPANQTRSGQTPNPADPRRGRSLRFLGRTALGASDCFVVLHPCSEGSDALALATKYPDGALDASLGYRRRDEYSIASPSTNDWNCLIYHLPFLKRSRVMFRWASNAGGYDKAFFDAALAQALLLNDPGNGPTEAAFYPTIGTISIGLVSVQYSILASSQLTPAITGPSEYTSFDLFGSVRRVAYGSTSEQAASDLYNQGRYIGIQMTPNVTLSARTLATTDASINAYEFLSPPNTTDSMVGADLRAHQADAKVGAYMPLRLSGDPTLTSVTEYRDIEVRAADIPDQTANDAPDLWLRGWNVGVELWTGLATQSTLRIKIREYLELSPSADSVLAPMTTPGHCDDDTARSIIREFSRTEPHAYPADFNDLGKMLDNILSGVERVTNNLGWGGISRFFGRARPITAKLAPLAETALSFL